MESTHFHHLPLHLFVLLSRSSRCDPRSRTDPLRPAPPRAAPSRPAPPPRVQTHCLVCNPKQPSYNLERCCGCCGCCGCCCGCCNAITKRNKVPHPKETPVKRDRPGPAWPGLALTFLIFGIPDVKGIILRRCNWCNWSSARALGLKLSESRPAEITTREMSKRRTRPGQGPRAKSQGSRAKG